MTGFFDPLIRLWTVQTKMAGQASRRNCNRQTTRGHLTLSSMGLRMRDHSIHRFWSQDQFGMLLRDSHSSGPYYHVYLARDRLLLDEHNHVHS